MNLNLLMRTTSLTFADHSGRHSKNVLGAQAISLLVKKEIHKVIPFVLIDHWLNCNTFQSKIFCSRTLYQTLNLLLNKA